MNKHLYAPTVLHINLNTVTTSGVSSLFLLPLSGHKKWVIVSLQRLKMCQTLQSGVKPINQPGCHVIIAEKVASVNGEQEVAS